MMTNQAAAAANSQISDPNRTLLDAALMAILRSEPDISDEAALELYSFLGPAGIIGASPADVLRVRASLHA